MKNRLFAFMLASMLVSAPASAIAEPSGATLVSNAQTITLSVNSIVNFASMGSIAGLIGSVATIGSFQIYQPGTPKVLTSSALGGLYKTVQTTQPYYWPSTGILAKKAVTAQYYTFGRLTRENTAEYFYDQNGRPASDVFYRVTESNYQYNPKSQKKSGSTRIISYDRDYRILQRLVHEYAYAYHADGSLAREGRVSTTYDRAGKVIDDISGRVVDTYTHVAEGMIKTHDYVSLAGKPRAKSAELTLTLNGLTKKYGVSYDLSADGAVVYTHTYEIKDGVYVPQDIPELSGMGYKTAAQVHAGIKSLAAQVAHLHVQGDMILNSDKIRDLSKFNINVSGSLAIQPTTNGYDIYVTGDLSLTKGTLDLKGLKVYVSGNMSVAAEATLLMDGTSAVNVGGSLNIGEAASTTIGGDAWVMDRNAIIQVKQSSDLPQNVQASDALSGSQTFSISTSNASTN